MIIYSQKYYTKYNQIVKHYKELDLKKSDELYTESHHILPKCMGGSNKKDNLVRIPARVHFLLHWMLWRIYRTPAMAYGWNRMRSICSSHDRYNSKSFGYARLALQNANSGYVYTIEQRMKMSIAQKGKVLSKETKNKMSESHKGKVYSEETKARISKSKLGHIQSEETKTKISQKLKGSIISAETRAKMSIAQKGKTISPEHKAALLASKLGKPRSKETKAKLSAFNKSLPVVQCPHCHKTGKGGVMNYWHFGNCRMKS